MKKILFINKDANIRLQFKKELEEEGYELLIASNIKEGEKIVNNLPPDLIVLDIRISGVEGIDFLKNLRDQDKKIPVIICTPHGEIKQDFQASAKDVCVVKSDDLTELKDAIKRLFSTT